MLSPEYLDDCANQLISLYSELENRIIADIVRRLLKTGNVTETAKWEILKAQELGLLYDDVLSLIASQTDATSNHVRALFEDAGVETVKIDNEKYRKMGKTPVDIRQSESMRQVLEAGYQKTLGNLKNLTMTTAITSQTAFINASNSAYMMVTSGAFSYQDAIRTAIKEMAQKGVSVLTDTIKYEGTNKKGQHYTHEDKIDVAIRRNVLTGVGQTCKQVSLTNATENGFDLMEINAHSGSRPSHAKFQGKRVSLSGRKGYLSLHDIGFGSAEGFGGCNCRHDWYPVDENDIPMYTDSQLKDFDARNIEYNGKKYTQYEATQIQRRKEREIRALKRESVAYDTAIKETDDEDLKLKLKEDFSKTSKKLKDKEKSLADFTKETGIKRDKFREQVQGFNRSVSSKSTWANKKAKNDLTSLNVDGILNVDGTSNNFNKSSNKPSNNVISKDDGNPYGFNRIIGEHSREDDLRNANPNKHRNNCQRCVVAFEMNRRGFDVIAKPKTNQELSKTFGKNGWPTVFKDSKLLDCSGKNEMEVMNNIKHQMKEWGNSSRAFVAISWAIDDGGHVFVVEQDNGRSLFLDPQNNTNNVEHYIYLAEPNNVYIMRVDNLEVTDRVTECCENREEN